MTTNGILTTLVSAATRTSVKSVKFKQVWWLRLLEVVIVVGGDGGVVVSCGGGGDDGSLVVVISGGGGEVRGASGRTRGHIFWCIGFIITPDTPKHTPPGQAMGHTGGLLGEGRAGWLTGGLVEW